MNSDFDRMQTDLAALRAAAGLGRAWTGGAIRTHLLLAAAGAMATIWSLIPHGFSPVIGLATFIVPVADWFWHARVRADRTATDDREWRESLRVWWYALPLGALAVWSRMVGFDLLTMLSLMWFVLGFVLYGSGISDRSLRPLLGWSLAFMSAGLVGPLRVMPIVPVLGVAIFTGALVTAAWIAADLRRTADT